MSIGLSQTNFFDTDLLFSFFMFMVKLSHTKQEHIIFQGLLATTLTIKANSLCSSKNRFLM